MRILILTLVAGMSLTASAQPSEKQWRKISRLPSGTAIELHETGRRYPVTCNLVWIDNHSLSCEVPSPTGDPIRTIYPATSLTSVRERPTLQAEENSRTNHRVLFAMVAGGLLGGALGATKSTKVGFVAAGFGAAIGGGLALGADSAPHPYSYPRPYPVPQWP